jgi:serine/threonine protein kinase/WD40 repeat protein
MSITSAASLVDVLRQHHLLDPAQLDEVGRVLQPRFPDPKLLARELMQRGWLSPFQANLLLQGRGHELVLGPYLLMERLGEGGMGQVYKARHQLMNRVVALKVIRKERLAHGDAIQRFQREIRMAAQLAHPNIVTAYDAAQVGDQHFLVTEYVEGTDLHRLVHKSGPLPVGLACAYVRQAALGLQHAHERGLVHRDVKPSNLLVAGQGTMVKVLDLGLARSQVPDGRSGPAELTQAYTVLGTPDYIAPEQVADSRQVDIRADIYSLGATFYFALAGRPPFPDGPWEEKLVAHRKAEPQPIEQLRPDVPPPLAAVLRKMMAKRPEDRYSKPVAVADALAPFCTAAGPVPGVAVAAPAALPSMTSVSQAGSQPGWTLEANSTFSSPQGGATSPPPASPFRAGPAPPGLPQAAAGGQPPWSLTAPAAPGARKRLWLVLAGVGGSLLLLILLLIVIWPRGGKDGKEDGKNRADKDGSSATGKDGKEDGKNRAGKDGKKAENKGNEGAGEVRQFSGHTDAILCVAFSPEGNRALSGGMDNTIRLWHIFGDKEPHSFGEQAAPVWSVAFSPKGRRALSGIGGGAIKSWNLERPKEEGFSFRSRPRRSGGRINLAFAGDGLRVLSGGTDGYAQEWRSNGRLHREAYTYPFTTLAFAPDDRLLTGGAFSGRHFLILASLNLKRSARTEWSTLVQLNPAQLKALKKTDPVCIFAGHTAAIFSAAFSRDGSRIVSGGMDRTVRVWNASTGEQLHCLEGHQDPVTAVAFSPDGRRVLSCSGSHQKDNQWVGTSDNSIRLWSVDSGKEIHSFKGHADGTQAVAISPDGRFALSGGRDKMLRLWRLPP